MKKEKLTEHTNRIIDKIPEKYRESLKNDYYNFLGDNKNLNDSELTIKFNAEILPIINQYIKARNSINLKITAIMLITFAAYEILRQIIIAIYINK